MDYPERILGRLEEFKDATNERLDKIEDKIDALHAFKWKIAGGAAVLSIAITASVQFIKFWLDQT